MSSWWLPDLEVYLIWMWSLINGNTQCLISYIFTFRASWYYVSFSLPSINNLLLTHGYSLTRKESVQNICFVKYSIQTGQETLAPFFLFFNSFVKPYYYSQLEETMEEFCCNCIVGNLNEIPNNWYKRKNGVNCALSPNKPLA